MYQVLAKRPDASSTAWRGGYPQSYLVIDAIESLNSSIREAIKKRKIFPSDDLARKMVYLTIKDASMKWMIPIQNWRQEMSRFIIEFEERIEKLID